MIREATELDALSALELGQRYVAEVGEYAGLEYDAALAVGRMLEAVYDERQLFVLSLNEKGVPVGMLWAVCAPILPWTPAPIAMDQIVYVLPEYRGTSHGIKLIRHYEQWAEDKGAVEIRLSIASGVHEHRTGKLYQKIGYSHLGSQYRRKI